MAGEKRPGAPRLINCISCGAGVVIRAQGHSVVAVCDNCHAELDAGNETLRILKNLKQRQQRAQVIELGARGKVHGILYECIGYMERSDASGEYIWSEYLLFNPLKGFRWLTEFDGHWNDVLITKNKPKLLGGVQKARFLDKEYSLFHQGQAVVRFVRGEFNWQVNVGDKVEVRDYINPPEILSFEGDATEEIWSLGTYIEADRIREAFQIKSTMPPQTGVGPNQPSTLREEASGILGYFALFVIVFLVGQFMFVVTADREVVYQEELRFDPLDPVKVKVTPPFELKASRSNLLIDLDTRLANGWLSLNADLVNDVTGESLDFEHGAEIYQGYDSDGSWREGSRSADLVLSSVPAGTYHVNFEADSRSGKTWMSANDVAPMDYRVRILRDVPIWSNFLWGLGFLVLIPVFSWWRDRSFEINRWSTSDFSPYFTSDDED